MNVRLWGFGLDLLYPTFGNVIVCFMTWLFYCLLLLLAFLCEAEVYVNELPDLTIFESRSVIFWLPFSHLRGLKCVICSWWCHVVTCFDLTIFGDFDQYYDLLWDTFWLLVREPLDIVIYHWCLQMMIDICCDHDDYYLILISCSWRTDVIIADYIYEAFSVACIGLRWFYDLWFHEPRVGYLCVVSGSGLQWGSGP